MKYLSLLMVNMRLSMKFKVGDKVRLKQSSKYINNKDKIFTVTFVHALYVFCELEGAEHAFKPYNLELINETSSSNDDTDIN